MASRSLESQKNERQPTSCFPHFPPPPPSFPPSNPQKKGADFIECDAVFTKDCELVCRHDADLTRSTDAASKFPSKTKTREIDGVIFSRGVFAADLTLSEVKTLRARQAKAASLGRTKEFDGLFPLVTLDEFAEYASRVPVDGGGRRWNESSPSSSSSSSPSSPPPPLPLRVVGVHVEAKHPTWHSKALPHCAADPAAMVEHVARVLQRHGFASRLDDKSSGNNFKTDPRWRRAPTFLQCFEPEALAEAHRRRGATNGGGGVAEGVPLVQLIDEANLAVPGGASFFFFDGESEGSAPFAAVENRNLTFADLLTDAGLERVSRYAHAIGPSVAQVLDFPPRADDDDEGVGAFSSLLPRASKRNLAVHAYNLRDDLVNLDRFKKIANGAASEAEALLSGARVEGAFGDFPSTLARAVREVREGTKKGREAEGKGGGQGGGGAGMSRSSFSGDLVSS